MCRQPHALLTLHHPGATQWHVRSRVVGAGEAGEAQLLPLTRVATCAYVWTAVCEQRSSSPPLPPPTTTPTVDGGASAGGSPWLAADATGSVELVVIAHAGHRCFPSMCRGRRSSSPPLSVLPTVMGAHVGRHATSLSTSTLHRWWNPRSRTHNNGRMHTRTLPGAREAALSNWVLCGLVGSLLGRQRGDECER